MPEQFLDNPGPGGDLVMLTRREYDALVEAAGDAHPEMADSVLPPLVAARVAQGAHILTALREYHSYSISALGEAAHVHRGQISECERGAIKLRRPSLERLAKALGVSFSHLKPLMAPPSGFKHHDKGEA